MTHYYFLGIVPPAEFAQRVQQLFPVLRTEPHITVRAPVGLPSDSKWVLPLREKLATMPSFTIHLTATAWFGQKVLYASAEAPELTTLHAKILEILPMSSELARQTHQGEFYQSPHLTLAYANSHRSRQELQARAKDLQLPYAFTASQVIVFHKKPPEAYRRLAELPLS